MTELNTYPETESDRAEVRWPVAPVRAGNANPAGNADVVGGDSVVATLLDRLASVPGLPASEHAAAYSDLHDALLAALNEDDPSAAGEA